MNKHSSDNTADFRKPTYSFRSKCPVWRRRWTYYRVSMHSDIKSGFTVLPSAGQQITYQQAITTSHWFTLRLHHMLVCRCTYGYKHMWVYERGKSPRKMPFFQRSTVVIYRAQENGNSIIQRNNRCCLFG